MFAGNGFYLLERKSEVIFATEIGRECSVSQGVLKRVYISLIKSVLGYNIMAWFGQIK